MQSLLAMVFAEVRRAISLAGPDSKRPPYTSLGAEDRAEEPGGSAGLDRQG